ncbi:MAG: Ig-like domain-containing protein [Acidobacteriaceae bacterium]
MTTTPAQPHPHNYTGAAPPPPSPLCTLPVTGGACPNSVGTTQGTSVGTNILTGVYLGDATHASSTSSPVTITVSPDTTSASVTGSPATSPQGQPVTFTATLTGNFAPPDGPVAFMYGSTTLCSLALVPNSSGVSSTATCTTSSLPAGTDQITASYAGDMNFLPAPSASFSETITPLIAPSFAVTVTPNPVSVGVGYAAILSVSVTPLNGFAQNVNLACGNLPAEATCIFTPSAIAGGAGSATLIVVTTAPHSCGTTQPYFLGGNRGGPGLAPLALPALAGLLAIFIPGKRRWLRALLAVLLAAGATHLIGCSTCTDLGTRPASYAFQVTAAAAAGSSEVESQAVTLNLTI